jgi:hypothetical protein
MKLFYCYSPNLTPYSHLRQCLDRELFEEEFHEASQVFQPYLANGAPSIVDQVDSILNEMNGQQAQKLKKSIVTKSIIAYSHSSVLGNSFFTVDGFMVFILISFSIFLNIIRRDNQQTPIDNSNLVDEEGNVKRGFVLNYDYVTVPLPIWNYFFRQYGGGPEIIRECTEARFFYTVDVYPLSITVVYNGFDVKCRYSMIENTHYFYLTNYNFTIVLML